jgi:hypothetical protein
VFAGVARADVSEDAAGTDEAPEASLDFLLSSPRFTMGVLGGWVWNRADSEIHDFLTEQFTLERSDFDAPVVIIDVAGRIMPWMDIVGGIEISSQAKIESEYRDYVDGVTGAPIRQTTQLTQGSITLSVRFYPLARERKVGEYAFISRRFVPYLGGGFGGTYYQLKQKGEFVDFVDETIFEGAFKTDGWGFSGHVFLGGELLLTRSITVALEARYQRASADVRGNFEDFGPIHLDGVRLLVGIHWRH